FVGEPLVAIVTETPQQGVDAAELVWPDVEPIAPVLDPEVALDGDVVLFPEVGTNVVLDKGDPVGAEDLADHEVVVSARMVNQRMAAVPLEGRVAGEWQSSGRDGADLEARRTVGCGRGAVRVRPEERPSARHPDRAGAR
ncbi:MAG: hypothetical protein WD826_06850, partial [Actinomycetota bacterium]